MSPAKVEECERPTGKVANNASNTKPTLSLRDQEILMAAWLSIKGAEPQVDYHKLARILNLKNAHCANTILYNVRKKVKAYHSYVNDTDNIQSPPPTPKAATPRKRAGTKDPQAPKSGWAAKRAKVEAEMPVREEQDGSV